MSDTTKQHLGTKFLGLFFGMILAIVYTLIEVFKPTFDITIQYAPILFAWVIFVIVIPLLIFLAEILWRYAHKYSEKFPMELYIPLKFLKFKYLSLNSVL